MDGATRVDQKDIEMNVAMQIEVENIKCGGCERSITKSLTALPDVSDLVIDREHQTVTFTGPASARDAVVDKLRSMGYPERAPWPVWKRALPMPSRL